MVGKTILVMRKGKLVPISEAGPSGLMAHDNGRMKSMAMGCATLSGQKKRIEHFGKRGVAVKFHPYTGQMLFKGGYQTQKKLAGLSNLLID